MCLHSCVQMRGWDEPEGRPVPNANAVQLSNFPMAFAMRNFFENVGELREKLVIFWALFSCSGFVSEGLDVEGLGCA